MTTLLSRPPIHQPIVSSNGQLSEHWQNFFSQNFAYITQNLSQNGYQAPSFTTSERDELPNPTEGTLIYNTTTQSMQFYNGTTWGDI